MIAENAREITQERDIWIFDVDDTLYPIDCGLHSVLKNKICDDANQTPALRSRMSEWLGEDRDVRPSDLGLIFPLIVMDYLKQGDDILDDYFARVYDLNYSMIKPDPVLVGAVSEAKAAGKEIFFYTNSPAAHGFKVMAALGFDDEFINDAQSRIYDLVASVKAGAGKPTPQGMHNFIADMGIDPLRAVFFDDGVYNLVPALDQGMKGIWCFTSENNEPKPEEQNQARNRGVPMIRQTRQAFIS